MHGQGTMTVLEGPRWACEVGGLVREREAMRARGVSGRHTPRW